MSEQQEHPEGAIAAQEPVQPAAEPEAPVVPPTPAAQEPPAGQEPPAAQEPPAEAPQPDAPQAPEPQAAEDTPAASEAAPAAEAAPAPDAQPADAAPAAQETTVGPKILGRAEERRLPVVKKRLQEKPKRDPLPWPELRAAVAATRDAHEIAELKELFRLFPEKLRDEVVENVRGFKKGARRPVSQHAAKQLARAAHTARRMKKNSHPSGEVGEALGQALAAEMIASLEPEKAAQVILPKRDLIERENRQAQRRARDEEDKQRDEQRRKRRDDARSSRQQTSFGEFSGAKIKGLDELAALFSDAPADPEAPAAAQAPAAEAPATTPASSEPEAPNTPATTTPEAEPESAAPAEVAETPDEAPVTPATTAVDPEPDPQVEVETDAPDAPKASEGDGDPA